MRSVLLAAAAGGGGGLTDVNLVLTVATVVLFLIFAWVLGKFAWGPLLHAIEAREKSVRDSVEGAQRANAEAAALLAQHQEMVRESGRQREEIIKQSLVEAEKLRQDLSGQARAEAEQILQKARATIDRETRMAIQELRTQVADLAVDAAARIVESSLTPEAQRKLVHEFIDTLPQARD